MNLDSLRKRLDALETAAPPTTSEPKRDRLYDLLEVLIAHHVGGGQPHEPLAVGFGRALGYANASELRTALLYKGDDLNLRWAEATRKLLALQGVSPDCDGQTFANALESLFRALPERYKQHPFLNCFDPEALFQAA